MTIRRKLPLLFKYLVQPNGKLIQVVYRRSTQVEV